MMRNAFRLPQPDSYKGGYVSGYIDGYLKRDHALMAGQPHDFERGYSVGYEDGTFREPPEVNMPETGSELREHIKTLRGWILAAATMAEALEALEDWKVKKWMLD